MRSTLLLSIAFLFSSEAALSSECPVKQFQPQQDEITYDGRSGEFFRNAFLPRSDDLTSYTYYPGSGYFVGDSNLRNIIYQKTSTGEIYNPSTTEAKRYVFHWANRCNSPDQNGCGSEKNTGSQPNTKGNLPEVDHLGEAHRFYFSSYNKANMCTLAQAHNLMGVPENTIRNFLEGGNGFNGWGLIAKFTEQEVTHAIEGLESGESLNDICYLYGTNGEVASHVDGFVIDYEVQDNRADHVTTNFLKRYSNFVKSRGKSVVLWTNPVLGAGWKKSGFSAGSNGNVHKVLLPTMPEEEGLEAGMGMDLASVLVHDGTTIGDLNCDSQSVMTCQLDAQSRAFFLSGADYNRFRNRQKLYVIVGIGGFAVEEAQEVRQFVEEKKLKGIATWNNGANFRSDQTCGDEIQYDVVNCLALGSDHCNAQ